MWIAHDERPMNAQDPTMQRMGDHYEITWTVKRQMRAAGHRKLDRLECPFHRAIA